MLTMPEDQEFVCYDYGSIYLGGKIEDGCLSLYFEVYGIEDGMDSEKIYEFSKTETDSIEEDLFYNFLLRC